MFFLASSKIKLFDASTETITSDVAPLPNVPAHQSDINVARVQYSVTSDKFVLIAGGVDTPFILDPANIASGWQPGKYTPESKPFEWKTLLLYK